MAVTSGSVLPYYGNEMMAVFNNDSNSTINHVTQMNLEDNATNVPRETEGISNFIIGTMMVVINGILIRALYCHRRNLNWKRFACILNLAISDFICGVVLMVRGLTDLSNNSYMGCILDEFLNLEVCASIIMTILNYDCELCVQYLAIKKPLFYHTKLTLTRILFVIFILWALILSYTVVKIGLEFSSYSEGASFIFKYIDLTAMGLSLIFNSVFYSYLLKVVAQKRKESINRRRQSEKISIKLSTSSSESDTSNISRQNIFVDYNTVITMGIQLVTYISTICPLFIYWIYSSIYGYDNFDTGRKVIDVVFESFWFVRAILDPLTFLLRERRLLTSCSMPSCFA